jgi:hypothetical protein
MKTTLSTKQTHLLEIIKNKLGTTEQWLRSHTILQALTANPTINTDQRIIQILKWLEKQRKSPNDLEWHIKMYVAKDGEATTVIKKITNRIKVLLTIWGDNHNSNPS